MPKDDNNNNKKNNRGYYTNKGYSKSDIIIARARRHAKKASIKRKAAERVRQIDKVARGLVNGDSSLPIDWTMSSGKLANFMRAAGIRANEIIEEMRVMKLLVARCQEQFRICDKQKTIVPAVSTNSVNDIILALTKCNMNE